MPVISNFAWLVIVGSGIACFLFGLVVGRLTSMSGKWNRRVKKRIQAVKAGIQSMDQEWKLEEKKL